MKKVVYFLCDNCGELFEEKDDCSTHEDGCLHLEVGQWVSFSIDILEISRYKGYITKVYKANPFRERPSSPFVTIETDEVIEGQVDWSQLHDGKHFYSPWDKVGLIDSPSQKDVA